MDYYRNILDKLDLFIRKYHTKILIKGVVLFLALGCLFLFAILAVEYFLWLQPTGRLVLLLLFIGVLGYLLVMYILTPLFFLFKIKKGISEKEASRLIGRHFPEVGDKLYNLLELAENREDSELVLASIEQRSSQLDPIPFKRAVDYRENLKYTKYLIFPLLIFLVIWFTGNLSSFFGSADRVVHYKMTYEPPAPFRFQLLSEKLEVLDNESFTISVSTLGDVQPGEAYVSIGGKVYMMQNKNDRFEHTLSPPLKSQDFYFTANGVRSRTYALKVIHTPVIRDFKLVLDYPDYTGKQSDTIEGTGNAIFPEGTRVSWHIESDNTDEVRLVTSDTVKSFEGSAGVFGLSQRVFSDMDYELATSNEHVRDYEILRYSLQVIKDEYPTIGVKQFKDSLNPNVAYFEGQATDDYKLKSIKLVCYEVLDPDKVQTIALSRPESNFHQFYYTFPSGLDLVEGRRYSYYFSAVDNDAVHGGKEVKSEVFSMDVLNEDELRNEELKLQESLIQNLDRSLDTFKEQKEGLKQINEGQKEKAELNFNDQSQVKDFLQRQKEQERQMEKFSKQLGENLSKGDTKDPLNKLLQERLERQEIEARKNQRLLEELNKIADKINKNELNQRLEQLAKKQQNSERNLEQLLELTKRYYVKEKAEQLAKDLGIEAEKQEGLSEPEEGEEANPGEQKSLNEEFETIWKEIDELQQDNAQLKKPLKLDISKETHEAVKKNLEGALKDIEEQQEAESKGDDAQKKKAAKSAAKKQRTAAQKMREMSRALVESAASSSSASSDTEDAEMLRQVLDNLVTFSFKQESLYERLDGTDGDNARFSNTIKEQQNLRDLFEHVDDSIFALSLRRAELSEFVNEQITEVYYNIDKSLESIAENQIYQGASYQKYVLSASNSLAAFLARILDNMQQSMMAGQGQGQGEGEGFQLPDIIKSQGELKEKMEGMGQSGTEGQGQGEGGVGEQKGKGDQGQNAEGDPSNQEGNQAGQGKGQGENGSYGSEGGEEKGGQGGLSENELSEIYEIYKEQQMLRQKLEEQLGDMMNEGDRKLGEKLVKQMEDFERDLLENGITQRGLAKVNRIQHELMKLENATLKQGKESTRESTTNKSSFVNPITTKPSVLENYRNEVEILNRQALPLRQNYQNKVKEYFKGND